MTAEDYVEQPFTKTVKRDDEGDFVARVVELPGCVAHGPSESEALENLTELQALWIADALEAGDAIPAPLPDENRLPSGRWVQRVPRTLHQRLAIRAKMERVSLNQLVTSLLAEGVGAKKTTEDTLTLFRQPQSDHYLIRLANIAPALESRTASTIDVSQIRCSPIAEAKTRGSMKPIHNLQPA